MCMCPESGMEMYFTGGLGVKVWKDPSRGEFASSVLSGAGRINEGGHEVNWDEGVQTPAAQPYPEQCPLCETAQSHKIFWPLKKKQKYLILKKKISWILNVYN